MDYSLEKIAHAAFELAKKRGKKFIPKDCCRGGLKYRTKNFNITAMFADGPDFGGSNLSDCSYLHISYKGRQVFSHQPLDDDASYKPGIWEDKLERMIKEMNRPKRRQSKVKQSESGYKWHYVTGFGWEFKF